MNCGLCHAVDTSNFIAPSKTLLFMEATLATNDYSGQVGPSFDVRSMAARHGGHGNIVLTDTHIEKLNQKQFDVVDKTKLFWFPTDDTTGAGGIQLGTGLK